MGPQASGQGCVVMVYGLNMDKINAEKLFNLFCLYGNVVRVSSHSLFINASENERSYSHIASLYLHTFFSVVKLASL
jgi:hypothetical protein